MGDRIVVGKTQKSVLVKLNNPTEDMLKICEIDSDLQKKAEAEQLRIA